MGAIILAAGASTRMGSPKAALEFEGETFLNRLIRLFSRYCDPVIGVLGYHAEAVRRSLDTASGVIVAVNPAPERGMLSSLQCGVAALPSGLDGFLFTPVDLPAVSRATIERLLAAFGDSRASRICIPVSDGRNGHPVICPAGLAADFLALDPGDSPKRVITARQSIVERVPVSDPGAVNDIDTPRDYRELLA